MRTHSRGRRAALAAAAALSMALSLAACGGDSGSGSDSKTVTIWSSVDQPVQDGLLKALEAKMKSQGIEIDWQKVENINQLIITKIQAGDTPDIALVPQPGVVQQMNQLGAVKPLDDVVDMDALNSSMVPGALDSGTVDGKLYGLLVSANVKGLVFYPKKPWEEAGYKAPTTIDELNSLTEQIKADGNTPWCMGIESDTATGWPATDWFETLVGKYGGAEGYNSWVSHETPFDS
ncbi:MAG: carbohydrate transporter substrate-binding protein, partial [Nocardioides sp.]|nr:carbohydrate transporter substrate-binding protein [Nocardioides sp.]